MNDYEFWQTIYRALMMAAKAIVRYKLTRKPDGERVVTADCLLVSDADDLAGIGEYR